MLSIWQFQSPQLNDKDIVAVAKLLTDKFKIRELGMNLYLNAAEVDSIMENNKDNINEAAYQVLQNWLHGQSKRTTAYVNLKKALCDSQLSMIANDALKSKCNRTALADPRGGARDARPPPLGVQILSFSCSFRQQCEK